MKKKVAKFKTWYGATVSFPIRRRGSRGSQPHSVKMWGVFENGIMVALFLRKSDAWHFRGDYDKIRPVTVSWKEKKK